MAVNVTKIVNVPNIQRLGISQGVVRYMTAKGVQVQSAAKRRLRESPQRIDTGTLLNSIQVETVVQGIRVVVRVGTNVDYAIYVHEGTRFMQANPFLADGLRSVFG